MIRRARKALARSDLFAFNVLRRDRWVAEQAASLPDRALVLDAGAGSAPYRALFAHCDYRTQDAAPLEANQLRGGAYTKIDYVCDAAAIPVPSASFDAVLCTEMLEHHPEPIKVVAEFARVLVPGGKLLLTAPLGSGIHQEPYHFYGGYTPYWYRKFLGEAGFEQIEIVANCGSLQFFAQESIRFLRSTAPNQRAIPLWRRILWLPFWIVLLPILGLVVPITARWLDRFDHEQRFTVGYHVRAIRRGLAPPP